MDDARELLEHLEWRWRERGTSRRGHLFDRRGSGTVPYCAKRPRELPGEDEGAWTADLPDRQKFLTCGPCERKYENLLIETSRP